MQITKKPLLMSIVALVLCLSMLLGTTYAWFTDSVTSTGNIIKSGNLDLKVFWTDDVTDPNSWRDAEDQTSGAIFDYDRWEPGYTCVRYIKIVNNGTLAFKYLLSIIPDGEVSELADVIDVYYVNDYRVDTAGNVTSTGAMTHAGTLTEVLANNIPYESKLLPKDANNSGEIVVAIALNMQESAGNKYQGLSIGDTFSIQFLATQYANEDDSFGADYDVDAEYVPFAGSVSATATVDVEENTDANGNTTKTVKNDTSFASPSGEVSFDVGAGTAVDGNTLTGSVTSLESTTSNFVASDGEVLVPLDIHVDGIAAGNTVPVIVTVEALFNSGLNRGNYTFGHVENGVTNLMTEVDTLAELDAHNEFYYDSATGSVTFALCSFSEVVAVKSLVSKWTGGVAGKLAGGSGTESDPFLIANADQLAYLGKLVASGFSYSGNHFKLLCDLDLGYNFNTDSGYIFTPVGYFFSTDPEEIKEVTKVDSTRYSTVMPFSGHFDGNGKTIKNIYQNTWEIPGDYEGVYYKDGFGLFAWLNNATIENLTVENFQSDGEFTPTGVIAAYAYNSTVRNVSIINCNPRVYNTGNGGIIGIAGNGNGGDKDAVITLENITVDRSNKISALWGSWDVACGGLVGMFRGEGSVYMKNCHVAAQIDVNSDVCGNYQYYRYRYAGMLVGTNKNMVTDPVTGVVSPDVSQYTTVGCTVDFGDWNDYYYCELVANTLASYTHDHQMSRLEIIDSVDAIWDDTNYTRTGNFIVITKEDGVEVIGDCYHIVNDNGVLKRHLHEDSGTEKVGGQEVWKEDKQRIHIPFDQLFTGYGWGVEHIPTTSWGAEKGVTVNSRASTDSVQKFKPQSKTEGTFARYYPGGTTTIYLNELFSSFTPEEAADVKFDQIVVSIAPAPDSLNYVTVGKKDIYTNENWLNSSFEVQGTGTFYVTISDYYFCKPTTVVVVIDPLSRVEDSFSALIPENETSKEYKTDTYVAGMRVNANASGIVAFKDDETNETVVKVNYSQPTGAASSAARYIDVNCPTKAGQQFTVSIDFKIGENFVINHFLSLLTLRGNYTVGPAAQQVFHRNAGLIMKQNGDEVEYWLCYSEQSEPKVWAPVDVLKVPVNTWIHLEIEYCFRGSGNDLHYVVIGSYEDQVNGETVVQSSLPVGLQHVHGTKGYHVEQVRIGSIVEYGHPGSFALQGEMEYKNFEMNITSRDVDFNTAPTDVAAFDQKALPNGSTANVYVLSGGATDWYLGDGVSLYTPNKITHIDRVVEGENAFMAINYHSYEPLRTNSSYLQLNSSAELGDTVQLSARFQLPSEVYLTTVGGRVDIDKKWAAQGNFGDYVVNNTKPDGNPYISLFRLVGSDASHDLVAMKLIDGAVTIFDPYTGTAFATFTTADYADKWFTVDVSYNTATGAKTVTVKNASGTELGKETVADGAFGADVIGVNIGCTENDAAIKGDELKDENYMSTQPTLQSGKETVTVSSFRRTLYVDDYSFATVILDPVQ
ncbi:MAG: SipW-dependent-type signal peptide-containing protein [Clostridia bacterium]|nr:SipW-dependent-type signal peptide-containing protein [Clostridia bacterium]